mgnify:CR=1 FL=1
MKSDYESLSTASSSISCNWNGPALALAFGSFYDAYYPFKSNEAICKNQNVVSLDSVNLLLEALSKSLLLSEMSSIVYLLWLSHW